MSAHIGKSYPKGHPFHGTRRVTSVPPRAKKNEGDIIPFHELPSDDQPTHYDGTRAMFEDGRSVEVGMSHDRSRLLVRIEKPLDNGCRSRVEFGLSIDAAEVLRGLLGAALRTKFADHAAELCVKD